MIAISFHHLVLFAALLAILCSAPITAIYHGKSVESKEAVAAFVRFGPGAKPDRLVCGGVLITWKLKPGVHKAYLGSRRIELAEVPTILDISSFEIHRAFQRIHLTSDLAIATLRRPPHKSVLKEKGIHPIRIDWRGSRSEEGRKMFAIGFGVTRSKHKPVPSRTLKNGTVYKLDTDTCVARWYRAADRHSVLCAQSRRTTTVCSGDSGGPIVVYKKSSSGRLKLYLMGIISAVVCRNSGRCCNPGAPVLSMNIESFKGWIEEKVGPYRRW